MVGAEATWNWNTEPEGKCACGLPKAEGVWLQDGLIGDSLLEFAFLFVCRSPAPERGYDSLSHAEQDTPSSRDRSRGEVSSRSVEPSLSYSTSRISEDGVADNQTEMTTAMSQVCNLHWSPIATAYFRMSPD